MMDAIRQGRTRRAAALLRGAAMVIALIASAVPAVLHAESQARGRGGPGRRFGTVGPSGGRHNDSRRHVRTRVVAGRRRVAPGGDLPVAVIFDHDEGWHTNTHDPVVPDELDPFTPVKTVIQAHVTQDGALVPHPEFIQWPHVHEIEFGPMGSPVPYGVYSGEAIAYLPVTVRRDAALGTAELTVEVSFQACDDSSCLGPTPPLPFTLTVEIVTQEELAESEPEALDPAFAEFPVDVWLRIRGGAAPSRPVEFNVFGLRFAVDARDVLGTVVLLLLAAVGGFVLNFTPCVLPVIPIKILSLSAAATSPGRCAALGLAMSAGIVSFWVGLGAVIATVSGISVLNILFKYPQFTIVVGLAIGLFALGMFGLFAVRLPRWVYAISPRQDTFGGSFAFGLMTAVLSTPCTAPFMGSAAAWAVEQHVGISLATFAAVGGGMALPYMVLSANPRLVERLPRTGPGSELLKQVMGLLLLAAAVYFIGAGIGGLVTRAPDPAPLYHWWVVFVFVALAGVWLVYGTLRVTRSATRRGVFVTVGVAAVAASVALALRLTDRGPVNWRYYTADRLEAVLREGNVAVIDFTAEWCLNCKLLEHGVLYTGAVVESLHSEGVVPMKVDLTTPDNAAGWARLNEFGRVTIPLLVVLGPDGREHLNTDAYTARQVIEAVDSARRPPAAAAE